MFVNDENIRMALRRFGCVTVNKPNQINDDIEIPDNMVCVCMTCKKTFLYNDLIQLDGEDFIHLFCEDCA